MTTFRFSMPERSRGAALALTWRAFFFDMAAAAVKSIFATFLQVL